MTKKKRPQVLVNGSTPLKHFKDLHKLIDQIYDEAFARDWTWEMLATKAGVGIGTVYNLGNELTMYPRLTTVYLLAKAVDMQLMLKVNIGSRLKVVG